MQGDRWQLAIAYPIMNPNFALQNKLDQTLEKIEESESIITHLKQENEELQKIISVRRSDELDIEEEEIKNLYKPSSHRLATLGIVFFLSIVITFMIRIENFSDLLKKYSPIDNQVINKIVFAVFIFLLIVIIKQYIENLILQRKVLSVCSTNNFKLFYKELLENKNWSDKTPKEFTELDVFTFINGPKKWYKSILSSLGFKLFHMGTNERIKNYFINTLLNRKLIKVYFAKELDRTFTIKDGRTYYLWNN